MAIEVVDLGEGREPRYGLISGWRRLSSLRALFEETGEARFSTVLARIRPPQAAGEAYVSMVEENEIRLGLSYYERARIATKAVEAGAFEHDEAALSALYASASRPRRSKIRSFAELVRRLDALLRFPASLGERIGLEMAKALREDPGFETRLAAALDKAAPESAEAEQEAIRRFARETPRGAETGSHLGAGRTALAGGPRRDRALGRRCHRRAAAAARGLAGREIGPILGNVSRAKRPFPDTRSRKDGPVHE